LIFLFLLSPVVLAGLAIIIIILIILIGIYLWKRVVTVPSMTLSIDKTQYDHGETVVAKGAVFSDGTTSAAGETVNVKLTDSAGTDFPVGTIRTGEDGEYALSFAVPSAVVPGGVTVTAEDEALGVSAQQTFTLR
jgi:hypothetical protein